MERGQPNNQLMDMLKLLQINMAMKNKQEQERKKQRRSSYPSNKYQSRSGRNQTIPKNIIYQNAQYTFDKNEYLKKELIKHFHADYQSFKKGYQYVEQFRINQLYKI